MFANNGQPVFQYLPSFLTINTIWKSWWYIFKNSSTTPPTCHLDCSSSGHCVKFTQKYYLNLLIQPVELFGFKMKKGSAKISRAILRAYENNKRKLFLIYQTAVSPTLSKGFILILTISPTYLPKSEEEIQI